MATTADRFGPWTWSHEHEDHFMVVYHPDGSHDYKWARTIQPAHAKTSSTPVIEHPHYDLDHCSPIGPTSLTTKHHPPQHPVVITCPSGSYFNCYPFGTAYDPCCPLHEVPSCDHLPFDQFNCQHPSNPYFRERWNLVRYYGHFGPATTTTTFCDYVNCKDPYCIETQMRLRGFRDDLKHHEDDDKNGSMKDGDNVGQHQRCRRNGGSLSTLDRPGG